MSSEISKNILSDRIKLSIKFLEDQSTNDFKEAHHIMKFPWYAGFRNFNSTHVGNVFQLSIIGNVLLIARSYGFQVNEGLINKIVQKILSLKNRTDRGWKYFPRLYELPPDTDDLAQIIQILLKYDVNLVQEHCDELIDFVIKHGVNNDGSIETWIFDSNSRNKQDKVYSRSVRKKWGAQSDPEVIANFIFSLYLIDKNKYRTIISNGVNFIKQEMKSDFTWSSTWYWGKSYGTFVCSRILSCLSDELKLLSSISQAIISRKNDSGFLNPLNEALNLLSLIYLNTIIKLPRKEIFKFLDYILETQKDEGNWEAVPFIRMNVKRTLGGERYLTYQSSIITTSFCLYAMILSCEILQ